MNKDFDFTDQDLREALRRYNEQHPPVPLPEGFADRLFQRLREEEATQDAGPALPLYHSPTLPLRRRVLPWAVAASLVMAAGLTAALWPRDRGTLYQDTFASAEEACTVLGNGLDDNTIVL